jgi:hypothetical protein
MRTTLFTLLNNAGSSVCTGGSSRILELALLFATSDIHIVSYEMGQWYLPETRRWTKMVDQWMHYLVGYEYSGRVTVSMYRYANL